MANLYIQTSGYFDRLDPVIRYETREELFTLLKRHTLHFRELILHAHLKRLNASLGTKPLMSVTLNLFTDQGKFHVEEEGYGAEVALKNGLLALRYRLERHIEIRLDSREKAAGRRALAVEG